MRFPLMLLSLVGHASLSDKLGGCSRDTSTQFVKPSGSRGAFQYAYTVHNGLPFVACFPQVTRCEWWVMAPWRHQLLTGAVPPGHLGPGRLPLHTSC